MKRPPEANPPKDQKGAVPSPAPLRVKIETVAYGGAGVGRTNGLVAFVQGTIPGETVRALPTRRQKRFCEAELLAVECAAAIRQPPVCKVFGVCGGCAYQHVPYATQLEWKTDQVRELLRRIGKINDPPVAPALPSPLPLGYRNRIRVHVADREGARRVGFYGRRGRQVVDVAHCPIASESVNRKLAALRSASPVPGEYPLLERPEVAFFEQTNDGAAAVLAGLVQSLAGFEHALLVDAYCGAGFFGHLLAPRFVKVVGIESHPGAVKAALKLASANESYVCGDVSVHLPVILATSSAAHTTVLLDPPAAGLAPAVLEILGRTPVAKLVYVSCDPATQARDLGALVERGYRLETVVPVDMFPQTADIEVVAALTTG
jgi:23S rRNA (uracil1939-C5)-methyltransferase